MARLHRRPVHSCIQGAAELSRWQLYDRCGPALYGTGEPQPAAGAPAAWQPLQHRPRNRNTLERNGPLKRSRGLQRAGSPCSTQQARSSQHSIRALGRAAARTHDSESFRLHCGHTNVNDSCITWSTSSCAVATMAAGLHACDSELLAALPPGLQQCRDSPASSRRARRAQLRVQGGEWRHPPVASSLHVHQG